MEKDGLKVPHVQRVPGKGGAVYLYFRKGGHREGPLGSADGTQALQDEVRAILDRLAKATKAQAEPRPDTVRPPTSRSSR